MVREVKLTERLTGLAIREYLLVVGEGYPHEFYHNFKKIKPTTSYASVRRYFYILRELGLIEPTRVVRGRGRWPIHLHRIVPGMEDERLMDIWRAPQRELYPATGLGRKRYRKRIEEGLPVPKGRRKAYRRI
jgi:hypothetical protein